MNRSGTIEKGRIAYFALEKNSASGTMRVESLKGELLQETVLKKGFPKANVLSRVVAPVVPAPDYIQLPEVVVTASYPPSGGISWGTWFSLVSMYNEGGGGFGYYGMGNPFSGGGSTGTGGGGGNSGSSGGGTIGGGSGHLPYTIIDEEVLVVDYEQQYDDPAIDLQKFINCFNAIPNAGATCKITILADVPVNSDPTKIMDWENGSPGHTFIRVEKDGAGSNDFAVQHIGFYPKSGWKTTLTPAPIDGKFVDNAHHEFNASYEVSITPEQLQNALDAMWQRRNMQYDIENNNCTDWAMQVMKATIGYGTWFEIPKFQLPGGFSPTGTNTPQGLYEKIQEMHTAGTAGAVVPVIGWAGASTGPCN